MYAEMDVTDATAIERVFAEFAAQHGGAFDVLLNNAGVAFIDNFEALPLRSHELVVQVNVQGVVNCTHLAFPYLSQGITPKVINMCSRAWTTASRARRPTRRASSSSAASPRR